MSELNVRPTPIQRNMMDVATDLTLAYVTKCDVNSVEEVQQMYLTFFAVAKYAYNMSSTEVDKHMPK